MTTLRQAARRKAILAQTLDALGYETIASRVDNCGKPFYPPAPFPRFPPCSFRLCPTTTFILGRKRAKKFMPLVYSMGKPCLLTITSDRRQSLRRDAALHFRTALSEFLAALRHERDLASGVYVIEAKHGKLTGWLLHAHLILDLPFTPHRVLSGIWRRHSGFDIVHIRRCNWAAARGSQESVRRSVNYLLKEPQLDLSDPSAVGAYMSALKGVRLFGSIGFPRGRSTERTGIEAEAASPGRRLSGRPITSRTKRGQR